MPLSTPVRLLYVSHAGRPLTVTQEAVADQLATAANIVMGNADQRCPAAVIREHGFALGPFEGWVPGIEPRDDLFRALFGPEMVDETAEGR